jgi:hypothetical protein
MVKQLIRLGALRVVGDTANAWGTVPRRTAQRVGGEWLISSGADRQGLSGAMPTATLAADGRTMVPVRMTETTATAATKVRPRFDDPSALPSSRVNRLG